MKSITEIKEIIGGICKYLLYSIMGLLFFCLFVVLIDTYGALISIIIIMATILVIFIMWAAVNWGNL